MTHSRCDSGMQNLEQDMADSLRRRQNEHGDPLEGLFTLTRRMETEEEDQFDVDLTILDFLTFKTTEAVFEWRSSSNPHQSDLPSALVTMTFEWRTLLKHRYDGQRLNNQTAFRSRLLQFALLFTHRLNHDKTWTNKEALDDIRAQNRSRGYYWQQNTSHSPAIRTQFDPHSEFPLSDSALTENRHKLASALDMPEDQRRWVVDSDGTPSLHCLLPLFVELTAARISLDDEWQPTEQWLQLAGEFMLQAVLEEYLLNGALGDEHFNTIFAFGCPGVEPAGEEPSALSAMRKIFCDGEETHHQIHGWAKVKKQYINELLPSAGASGSFIDAMEAAQNRFPYMNFEAQMLDFLKHLHKGTSKPDLAQVEEGRISIHGTELLEADSKEMMRRMGL